MLAICAALYARPAIATDKPHPPMPTIKPEPVVTDTWNGGDKRDHLLGSALLGAGARAFLTAQPVAAGGLCMIPGVLKEAYDARRGAAGAWSWKDLGADLAGCALGVYGADVALTKDGKRHTLWLNWRF